MKKTRLFLIALTFALLIVMLPACSGTTTNAGGNGQNLQQNNEKVIAFGERVNIKDYLVKGKTVIFDFFSQYCPPCMRISPLLAKLDKKRDDIVVIKVNINRKDVSGHIDWSSPVARQYNLNSIPHFKIFSPEGKLIAEGDSAYMKVIKMLKENGIQ